MRIAQLPVALADPRRDALPQPPRDLAGLPPAVIVDIDETLLDNTQVNARAIVDDDLYDDREWMRWVARAEAPALPGAAAFLQAAVALGITPYYLTNREPGQEEDTLHNIRRKRFSISDVSHIPPSCMEAQRATFEPYADWLGQRWFVLPNPVYGGWYSAPYGNRHDLPEADRRAHKRQALALP